MSCAHDGAGQWWTVSVQNPESEFRHLLTGKGFNVQAGHNDTAVKRSSRPGCFLIVNGPELGSLNVWKVQNHYVFYRMVDKRQLASVLKLELMELSSIQVYIEHRCLQNADAEYLGNHNMIYWAHLTWSVNRLLMRYATHRVSSLQSLQRSLRQVPEVKPIKTLLKATPLEQIGVVRIGTLHLTSLWVHFYFSCFNFFYSLV